MTATQIALFTGALVASLLSGILFIAGSPAIELIERESANLSAMVCAAVAGVFWLTYAVSYFTRKPILPAAIVLSVVAGFLFISGSSRVALVPTSCANLSGIACGALAGVFWALFVSTRKTPKSR